jgi:hypothetical protein
MRENDPLKPRHPRLSTALALALLLILLLGAGWSQSTPAQSATPPPPQSPNQPATPAQANPPAANPSGTTQVPGAGVSVQVQPPGNAPQESPEQPQAETRITKAQAKELFRSVDVILKFASQDTGLPIKSEVKRHLITRESMEKYVNKRMKDDKDAQRLEQSRLVLEKFGLLPKGYDLHSEFLRLLAEQVAAYYDPKTKSVNLLDWVPPDTQKPVLAHELTHALQDQKIGLDKWERAGAKDDNPLPDPQEYVVEEAQAARQCVAEGQAMVVLFDYTLAPMGKDVISASEVVDAMRAGMADSKDSPVFAAAPMFLRESLMMPYTFGTDFVRTVLTKKGKDAAYGGMLENPPVDTRQVMQPESYLLNQVVAPPEIPDLDKLVAPGYQRFDFGGMGEFDVYLLAKQYGGDDAPPNYYPHWRGGYYFAAHAKTAPKDQIAMLYFSRWDSPESAHDFAKLYADYLPKRYQNVGWVAACPAAQAGPGCNHEEATTEQGKVVMEFHGNDLLIMEGYDDSVIERARDVLLGGMPLPATAAKSGK